MSSEKKIRLCHAEVKDMGGVGGVRASLLTSEKASTALSCRPLSAEQFAAWNLQSAETNVPSNSEVVASVWTRDEEEGRERSVRRKYEKQPCKKKKTNKSSSFGVDEYRWNAVF